MADPPPTILQLKQTFLTNQTRLLSQPLAPSHSWRAANSNSDHPLPDKAVDEALFRLNQTLAQHSRRVHPPQAIRHVAEQLDTLYWNAISSTSDDATLTVGHNLSDAEAIDDLPESWPLEAEVERAPSEAARYEELVSRLKGLSERRREMEGKLARLKGMTELMEPFEGGTEGVQENLLTRGGEVEKELERMRILLARVGGRVGHLLEIQGEGDLFGDGDGDVVEDVEVEERKKVDKIIRRFGRRERETREEDVDMT
ncbi:hypothetical protein DL546_007797 [Coniochaeta pulveracea]|uniref:Kinetochore protein fta4 n=1 Tax=Coniochaeta pulveracea TaxID=177199 RepID=A0A420YG01_9PEZI|nr:hypothetical protein DL546_007797 [Coniochaeta pulveracea]